MFKQAEPTKPPEFRIWLEENPSLGLWTATVTRHGKEYAVIVDSTRTGVISEAKRQIYAHARTHAA